MDFSEKIPLGFQDAVNKQECSVCRQILISHQEHSYSPYELEDPIGDHSHEVFPGVIHRYPDRLLFLLTQSCVAHCRFCFRKISVAQPIPERQHQDIQNVREYLLQHPHIREVILSGGEPLLVSNDMLQNTLQWLGSVETIKILRIHTRLPVTMPTKITPDLVDLLKQAPKTLWMVIHTNHVAELTGQTITALQQLHQAGIPLLSQSVLLAGVNDSFSALADLFQTLLEYRIKPYYLHYLDLVPGTTHFRVPLPKALDLMRLLRGHISGMAIPDFIVDIPGGHGKIVLVPSLATQVDEQTWQFQSPLNQEIITVKYPPSPLST